MALTEGKLAGEFMVSEANGRRSRESITVLLGENLKAGHVVGRKLVSPTVAAAVALGTNVGDGVFSVAAAAGVGVQRGTYRILFVEPAANLGTFQVIDPSGKAIGDGVVGTGFVGEITFTIADGATDFVAGDAFQVTVSAGTHKYKEYDVADTDGGQRPSGVLYDNVDATSADKAGVALVRDAEVRSGDLTWFSGATDAQKAIAGDALAALGVIVRT